MSKIDIKKQFGHEIETLWNDFTFYKSADKKIKARGFAVPEAVTKNALLFIGINPSYDKKQKVINPYYKEDNDHKYFNKFRILSSYAKMPWTHLDLLYLREREQNSIVEMWNDENNREFFKKQLAISKDIIEAALPRIIVVNNTFARDLLLGAQGEEKMFAFEFSDVLGTHKIVDNEALGEIPVFFTSMLTGQRALDNGSFERLGWHIKFVRDKKNDPPV